MAFNSCSLADRIKDKVGRELKYDIGHWKMIIICYQLLQS